MSWPSGLRRLGLAIVNGIVAIAVPAVASVTITVFIGWVLITVAAAMVGINLIPWGVSALRPGCSAI